MDVAELKRIIAKNRPVEEQSNIFYQSTNLDPPETPETLQNRPKFEVVLYNLSH